MEVTIYVPTKLLTGILNTVEIGKPEGPGLGRARALSMGERGIILIIQ